MAVGDDVTMFKGLWKDDHNVDRRRQASTDVVPRRVRPDKIAYLPNGGVDKINEASRKLSFFEYVHHQEARAVSWLKLN